MMLAKWVPRVITGAEGQELAESHGQLCFGNIIALVLEVLSVSMVAVSRAHFEVVSRLSASTMRQTCLTAQVSRSIHSLAHLHLISLTIRTRFKLTTYQTEGSLRDLA